MVNNVIAFGGRKESGKTELANICTKFGYEKISFALPLKTLVSHIINCDINEINALKKINKDYFFDEKICQLIAQETNIPIEYINNKLLNKHFCNTREILQYVGTNVIREYDNNWHVKKIKEIIKDEQKYVFDDLRFPNEAEFIKSINGDCWFVIRSKLDNVSNHASEISLKWQDFDNVILNNKTLSYLCLNWTLFMENSYELSKEKRSKVLNSITINDFDKKDDSFTILDSLFIYKDQLLYNNRYFKNDNIVKLTYNDKQNLVFVHLNDNSIEAIRNPFIIEDLKKYI